MAKRSVVSFFIVTLLFSAMLFRIAYISDTLSAQAGSQKSSRLMTVGHTRGMIYDRNMKPLVNREMYTVLVVNPTAEAMTVLEEQLQPDEYATAQENAKAGRPFLLRCDTYNGECEDIKNVIVYDRYSGNDTAVHLIGYLDSEGNGISGVEKAFDSLLKEHSGTFSVRYNADASGKTLSGMGLETVNNNYDSRGGIVLTIDSEIQRICENSMKWNNLEKGAVVVLDVATSEILAMASTPVFDRENLSVALRNDDSPFLNRALESYAVGSVFKPVVAVAALENGINTDVIFNCDGCSEVSGVRFNCHKRTGHGMNDMLDAMSVSCNSYFINLGQAVGADDIILSAYSLGFGKEIVLCDSIISDMGNLPDTDNIDSLPALANLSFGQGALLATPLQIAAAYCAFANGGYYREPYVLKNMIGYNGEITAYYKNEINNKVLPDSVCEEISEMLAETVKNGSGKLASPMVGDAAGKTATAETGRNDGNKKIVNTWFAGFYPAENPEYVIVIFREDGNSSSTDCAPVFRDIADCISGKTE
ncbi:MAG: penicillin-binding protein 2 [Clostridia bacterium]|nr:penicillin-binding protein 2 [Clostridia bacterium]